MQHLAGRCGPELVRVGRDLGRGLRQDDPRRRRGPGGDGESEDYCARATRTAEQRARAMSGFTNRPPWLSRPCLRHRAPSARSTRGPRAPLDGTAARRPPGVVVGVPVALAVPEGRRPPVVGVAQVGRDLAPAARTSAWARPRATVTRFDLGARARWIDRLGQVELGLGEPDELDGPGRGVGHHEGQGIGQPDVLAGQDDQAPGDEAGVLARLEHAGQPVQAGVGVRPPDALDEGADLVVVVVGALVEEAAVAGPAPCRPWRARPGGRRRARARPAPAATSRVRQGGPGVAVGQAATRASIASSLGRRPPRRRAHAGPACAGRRR